MQWTDEQVEIFDAGANSNVNMLIQALAGAAKSTTLRQLAQGLNGSVISLAFNKKIATEMKEKMPPNVDCKTLNSLGHSIWGKALKKKLRLDDDKISKLLKERLAELPKDEAAELSEDFGDLMRAFGHSKNSGHVPDAAAKRYGSRVSPLMNDEQFFNSLPDEWTGDVRGMMLDILAESFAQAMEGTIDFADQLLMPTVVQCMFPVYENVLVDEAQDLSLLNHVMLSKLTRRRIIAVGDSFQAIYAFRGAHTDSMSLLRQRFSMEVFSLTTTFRCPQAICDHVRWRAPEIQAWADNPANPGEVAVLGLWDASNFPDGSAIICRNNAPLFRMAIYLLKNGRRPKLWGNDVAAGLVKTLESLGPKNMDRKTALAELAKWREKKLAKAKRKQAILGIEDRVDCLREFIEASDTLGGAQALARDVLSRPGSIDLCTGHKSKGYEWQEVFYLDEHLCSDEQQDQNLRYVISTRAQRRLTYINSDGRIE